jgi:hypothetical protein
MYVITYPEIPAFVSLEFWNEVITLYTADIVRFIMHTK